MDDIFNKAEVNNCNALAAAIENQVSGCEVTNLGASILVHFQNKSVGNVFPITANTIDIFCLDVQGKEYDLKDVSVEKCLAILQSISAIRVTEETSTGDVAGYDTSRAFAAPGQKSNRATVQSQREGWKVINEIDRLKFPFGEDPLGANERNPDEKSNSEGKRKSAIAHNFENGSPLSESSVSGSNETLFYLAEMLPCDNAEIEGNILTVSIDSVEICITQQTNGNFSVHSSVDGEEVQANENVSAGDVVRWAFEICGKIQARVAAEDDENNVDISNDDIYGTLKELARETGKSDDILRNKDLFDLKQGLCVTRQPFDRRQSPESFVAEASGSQVSASLKGSTMKNGMPVSINENRDMSRPFQDTSGGKKLVYLEGIGATLVNKSDLPKKLKLNFDPKSGQVIFTPEDVPTCRTGMWKFFGKG